MKRKINSQRVPKGWVRNPKTLADVIQSIEALGHEVDYAGKGKIDPRKVRLQ